jgi:hypothetical protein
VYNRQLPVRLPHPGCALDVDNYIVVSTRCRGTVRRSVEVCKWNGEIRAIRSAPRVKPQVRGSDLGRISGPERRVGGGLHPVEELGEGAPPGEPVGTASSSLRWLALGVSPER